MIASRIPGSEESGSVLPLLGALIFVAFAVIALVTEIALLHGAFLDVASTADRAAEAGAARLDPDALHRGEIGLAPAAARAAAEHYVDGAAPNDDASVSATVSEVCVTVERAHRLNVLSIVGIRSQSISVEACAAPAAG